MTEHSLNGPSSFARRIGCPGSANAERGLPDHTSVYAAEGSAAHELGEHCLKSGLSPDTALGETIDGFEVDADMVEAVTVYTDYCFDIINRIDMEGEGSYLIEEKLDLPFIGKNEIGKADFIGVVDDVLHVVDYKHGKGVAVEAKENTQGTCYGLGAAQKLHNQPWSTLRITIVQPRAPHKDGPIRIWDIERDDVMDYLLEYAEAAELTKAEDAPRIPGPWCKFCKAKPTCPAHETFAAEAAASQFDDTTEPTAPEDIDGERLADLVLNRIPVIEDWCKSVKEFAQAQAEAGNPPPGTKLVATRASRYFKDEHDVKKAIHEHFPDIEDDKLYAPKKFKSVAQIEKVVGKKNMGPLNDLVEKKSTGLTLVPESDPREPAKISAADQFGSVE